jgi:hypothetical protein
MGLVSWVRFAFAASAAGLFAGAASAAQQPVYGPPAPWVDLAPIPAPPPPDGAAAVQMVLDDNQTRLSPDGDFYYDRRVYKVLKPEGLAAFKTQSFTWAPDTETVTIHAIRIIRDGQAIDLLKGGQDMPVLRRETNMERAMLDGRLSVSRQIEGLQTGDMVEVSSTRARRDPIVQGRSQDYEKMTFPGVAARYRVRLSWPDAAPVKWKATEGYPAGVVSKAGGWNLAVFDASGARAPKPPEGAPLRFRRQGELEVSSFKDWAEVSRLMAPLYAKAEVLAPESAIKVEAAAIRAASPDPKARAFAALRLVEDKTRYLFLGMNDGGYVPAAADITWVRKFGDCKGKTVLLLALLKELGIAAEPALVSIGLGDGMDERLPGLTAFNHVIVRATIDGKVYWLDGTRTGDITGLDTLRPPPWRWALPVRAQGAGLEKIVLPPLDRPSTETTVHLDASRGLDVSAPVRIEIRMTGDQANAYRQGLAQVAREDVDRAMRQSLSRAYSWIEIETIAWIDDAAGDSFKVSMVGKAEMDWRKNPDLGVREFKLPGAGAPASPYARREPGPARDAPYAVPFPFFNRTITEIALPGGGAGFSVRGPNDKETVGGVELRRVAVVEGGVARFISEGRSVVPEISAVEADAANKTLRQLSGDEAFVRAPS